MKQYFVVLAVTPIDIIPMEKVRTIAPKNCCERSSRSRVRTFESRLYVDLVVFLAQVFGILAMNETFRLTGAVERDPSIDVWLSKQADELHSIAHEWFARMRECGDDVRELIHDGCPVACVEDAPFGYVNVFKAHVNVGFFQGAALQDLARLLEGNGKRMRHVKLKPGSEVDSAALGALIVAAYLDIKARLEIG
jgi:hypothetical protein